MAYFAKLDENNIVLEVHVVNDNDIQNLLFPESEAVGVAYLNSFLPQADWKQTSIVGEFRVRYASIGCTFYPDFGEHGGFANLKLTQRDVFDESTLLWSTPPLPTPVVNGDIETL